MQILHTLSGPNLGGLEFRVLDQARWLREQGHAVAIAAPPQSETLKLARSWGLAAIGMDFNSPYSWSGMLRLRQIVRDLRIQVIDAHGTPDAKASALCRDLCSLVRTWHFRGRCARHGDAGWNGAWVAIASSRQARAGRATSSRRALPNVIASVSLASGPIMAFSWRQTNWRCAMPRARSWLSIPPRSWWRPSACCGQTSVRKTCCGWCICCASAAFPRALVVGAPTRATAAYGQQLHDLAAELGIGDHVTFAGHREDIRSVIHAADAVLVPSINEAWSRVVPEAYASRCPVVASAVGGLPEIVHPGSTGWLAPAADVAGFADHLAWIWSHPGEAARIAEQARTFADRHLMLSQKMAETLSAYEAAMTHAGAVRNVEATA